MKRWIVGAAILAGLSFAGTVAAQDKVTLSIGTGGTGGVYYPLGGGLANLLTKYVPGYQATAEVTGGSVDNLKLLGAGKSEVALTMADVTQDAQRGEDKFKGNAFNVRTLAVLYPNRMHVVSIEGMGINDFKDLKGKRVSTGSTGSATEVMAFRVMEALGLDKDKDVTRERLGVAESVNALKDKKIAAFFWVGGLPTAAVTDLGATPGVKIRMIDHEGAVEPMNKKFGGLYSTGVIPAGTYPSQTQPSKIAVIWNLLVAHEKLPDQVVANVLKTMWDKKPELITVHKEAASFLLENQKQGNSPVPFHAGALKYYAEKGIKVN